MTVLDVELDIDLSETDGHRLWLAIGNSKRPITARQPVTFTRDDPGWINAHRVEIPIPGFARILSHGYVYRHATGGIPDIMAIRINGRPGPILLMPARYVVAERGALRIRSAWPTPTP